MTLPPIFSDSSSDDLLAGLNPEQARAVEYRGPALLIVAGAGSGKTRVLTHRIASLIRSREAWPSQILAITFTNKAAAEMRERVEQLLGQAAEGMWISTFHSACVRILRREAERFGYVKSFTIYDSADSRALLKRIIKDLDLDHLGLTPAGTASRISKLKNELTDVDAFARSASANDPREQAFLEVFRRYSKELARAHAFDFDDLIGQVVFLFRAFPEVAALYQRRFRHILVDEYQDTNHAQYALIRELTRPVEPEVVAAATFEYAPREVAEDGSIPGAGLTVVGDSDQSIYAFRGADIRNITEFERDYPGAEVVMLEQNYRSTQNILSAANAVISNNFDRKAKNLWTGLGEGEKIVGFTGYSGHDEARFIADEIEDLHRDGVGYKDMAVFYRTNAQTRALEEIFIREAIPYRVLGGTKFYERAEIKDAIAYLITVANPFDEYALRRILNSPKRGIGPMTEAQLAAFAEGQEISFRDAMRRAAELGYGPKVRGSILTLSGILDHATSMALTAEGQKPTAVSDILNYILTETGYLDILRASKDPQDEARAENVDELLAVTREFSRNNPESGLVDFLTEVSLVAAADDLDDTSGTVSLMTLHTAKGLEYRAVFITGVEEGLLPHQMSADEAGGPSEERRLFYVGITRAREKLFLSLAMTRAQYGEISVALPSRFLQEIPPELISWKQSPGMVTSREGTQPRALNAQRGGPGGGHGGYSRRSNEPSSSSVGFRGGSSAAVSEPASGNMTSSLQKWREAKRAKAAAQRSGGESAFPNTILGSVQDNGDLELAAGDRVEHSDYGPGVVSAVTGVGTKRIAHVDFEEVGPKKILIKIAPITKVSTDSDGTDSDGTDSDGIGSGSTEASADAES
ncbi:ATP-dependent helicase [Klugiella xanthotipulae]|uniref:DNA 3'-5' helicase n=1 Tax=Klugiella xanthotipulae TaxID=244735 RepID=A0A543I549_9MICO|nr:UvrD-helicase domain-containing protein [Klugiella xanthotipulae]TQM65705.1 ATP-dependent DNA helicase PcrA [Klugiella xanthotipulae]